MKKVYESETLLLRHQAEELLKNKSVKTDSIFSEAEMLKFIHELEVHQIELEMQHEELKCLNQQKSQNQYLILELEARQVELKLQNKELMLAKECAELEKEKYTALYDFAPSGYFTLSREGGIVELNLCGSQMLGIERSCIVSCRFDYFVAGDSKPIFNQFLAKLFNSKAKESCDLILSSSGCLSMNAHLNGIVTENGELCMVTVVDITELKTVEMALLESKELYTDLVSHQSAGIYRILVQNQSCGKLIMESISMEFASERFCRLLEIDASAPLDEIYAVILNCIHPDDLNEFINSNEVARQSQRPYFWEGRLLIGDRIKWVRFESGPKKLDDGNTRWTGVAFDITGRKQTDLELKESEEKYRFLAENISDVIWTFNIDKGKFTYVSPSVFHLRGFTDTEAMEESIGEALIPESAQKATRDMPSRIDEFKKGVKRTYVDQVQQPCRDGSLKWVEIVTKFQLAKDGTLEIQGVSRDISERKKADAEIKLKNEELQKINAEKDKYFSIIAHDLRSPFSGFLGLTELMAEGLQRMTLDDIQKIAVLMKSSATNLFRLLGNLLEWSRMQRGLTTFNPATFFLMSKICENMLLSLEAANKKEIAISYVIPNDFVVYADVNMFESILRNLVSNAVKFTPSGGKITISATTIYGNCAEISISDSGIGMNQEMLNDLFRLDLNTNRKGTEGELSTGLGLFICRDFVEKHGGKLWVESEEGIGSTFRFTLPANQPIG